MTDREVRGAELEAGPVTLSIRPGLRTSTAQIEHPFRQG